MRLIAVNVIRVRPDGAADFLDSVHQLAPAAGQKKDSQHWTMHQTLAGEQQEIAFVTELENFAALEARGPVDALYRRLLGEKRGTEASARASAAVIDSRTTVSIRREDLSYTPGGDPPTTSPFAVVTRLATRPGQQDACEELLRKIAEAIPKVDDPLMLVSHQVIVGNLRSYWTVRPLQHLAILDEALPAPDLLMKAFGSGEGGLDLARRLGGAGARRSPDRPLRARAVERTEALTSQGTRRRVPCDLPEAPSAFLRLYHQLVPA